MTEADQVVVLITTANEEEAHRIAEMLLNQRKAACVNVVSEVSSLFCWEGKLDSAQESLLIAKTRESMLHELVEMVKEAHSYQVPEIIALPIIDGNEDYLKWIDREVV